MVCYQRNLKTDIHSKYKLKFSISLLSIKFYSQQTMKSAEHLIRLQNDLSHAKTQTVKMSIIAV